MSDVVDVVNVVDVLAVVGVVDDVDVFSPLSPLPPPSHRLGLVSPMPPRLRLWSQVGAAT